VHFLNVDVPVQLKEVSKSVDKPTDLIPNPDYDTWVAKDQLILNYVLSISREILVQVATCTTVVDVWKAIQDMTTSQSRGRVINTRIALATAQKGSSIAEFFSKMKSLVDDMASTGNKLEQEEIASYILTGLDIDFNPVVSAMAARVEPLSLGELHQIGELGVADGSAAWRLQVFSHPWLELAMGTSPSGMNSTDSSP